MLKISHPNAIAYVVDRATSIIDFLQCTQLMDTTRVKFL